MKTRSVAKAEENNRIIPTWVALIGVSLYSLCMYSSSYWAAKPQDFAPILTKYTGRWSFLTFHSNFLNFVYWLLLLLTCISKKRITSLEKFCIQIYPLMFTLGVFICVGYYALDHFNPVNMSRKIMLQQTKYPMIFYSSHCEHGHALPAALLLAFNLRKNDDLFKNIPTVSDVFYMVGGYIIFYLIEVHWIYYNTGEWVYPVIKDVTMQGGDIARIAFLGILTGINILLGLAGLVLVNSMEEYRNNTFTTAKKMR